MLPSQLAAASFAAYPETARRIAVEHIGLLRQLPLAFVPLLLRELSVYDWKFPAERRELDAQLSYLGALSPPQLAKAMTPFAQLRLSPTLEKVDWVGAPRIFTEQLTAHLWSTHQIDAFRAAAIEHMRVSTAAAPPAPLAARRVGIAVIGQGVEHNEYRLFRKLRPRGVYFSALNPEHGLADLVEIVAKRAAEAPAPYGHWHIDGGEAPRASEAVTSVSYAALAGPRAALQARMRKIYEAPVFDPEAFRTRMAQTEPADIGMSADADPVLARYELSLLTEGSGSQVFATTFVQWAAREALRRAEPLTVLARFAPRQRENPMNVLLEEAQRRPELDPQGSLIDADMGAYYTWMNQQRLTGADRAAFLAWFEGHREAVVVAPGFAPGTAADTPLSLRELVARIL